MNPSTAFGRVLADELARCGLGEVVLAPGSRSTPLAMAFHDLDAEGRVRLHVRVDERSASFLALGLAKVSRRPAAVVCTSGTAAANFHPAVIEADESGVPLLVLTADRPPELRAAGASQTIDQVKMFGGAVRWYADPGVPDRRPGAAAYWRSLACQAWAQAAGAAGTRPGPVHLNLPFRDPLVPDGTGPEDWPDSLDGRPGGEAWTRFAPQAAPRPLDLPWTERGVIVCGDGDYDAAPLLDLAVRAGWPVLAEPSSAARRGPNTIAGYQYLLASGAFMAAHRPDVIVSAGRPGLSRPQAAVMALARSGDVRHIVIAQGPGRWADPQRAATDIAAAVRLTGAPGQRDVITATSGTPWLREWRQADEAARRAAAAVLETEADLTEPAIARELLGAAPAGALIWAGNSTSVRDIDCQLGSRDDLRVVASRGASGIDGTTSTAAGAALAHAAAGGGPAFALIGDLAFVHDAPGLAIGPGEPRPDLCVVVVNNDGGGIFESLEPAAFPSFERVFGTPHGASAEHLAAAFGLPYALVTSPGELAKALDGTGLRVVEARTGRAANADLRSRMRAAAVAAVTDDQQLLRVCDPCRALPGPPLRWVTHRGAVRQVRGAGQKGETVIVAVVIGAIFLAGMLAVTGYAVKTLPPDARVPLNAGVPEYSVWLSRLAGLAAWTAIGVIAYAAVAWVTTSGIAANWSPSFRAVLLPVVMLVVLAAEAGAVITARKAVGAAQQSVVAPGAVSGQDAAETDTEDVPDAEGATELAGTPDTASTDAVGEPGR